MATAKEMQNLRIRRKQEQGLARMEVWVPKDDKMPVRRYVEELIRRADREKDSTCPTEDT